MARARLNADCGTAGNRLGALPMPQPVGFAMPLWAMPEPVVVIVPAQPPTQSIAPAPAAPARPAARGPAIKA